MATLIQSKQIEGIVTSSVIHGEFLVSGSLTVTGSNSILGSVTASAISSSFVGDGSGLTGITYSQIDNTPQFVGGNNVTITSSSNVITVHAVLDGTGSDAQSLSISGDQLTILGGNTITIPTGSTSWEQISNIPSNIVSGSIQILGGSGVLSGSKTDISSLNTFSSSIQSEVDTLSSATSSYLTSSGSVDFSDVTSKPSGLVSSSAQITISESQISDLTHYTNTDVRTYIDSIGVVSGSYVESLPQGLISGSTFTDYSSSIETELGEVRSDLINQFTNADNSLQSSITSLESYTSSIQSEVDSLTSATSSYITEIPQGTISGSSQISIESSQITDLAHTQIPAGTISGSEQLPSGLVSASAQITITESQISDLSHTDISNLNTFTSSIQTEVNAISAATSSYLTEVPAGTVSGSSQIIDSLPSGLVSGSTQITDGSGILSGSFIDKLPNGTISGSEQLPSGLVSASAQITISESQISDLDKYTDSDVQTYIDSIGIVSGSVVADLPSGVVSGSQQITDSLPSGTVSGSDQITITESQISDLSHTDISSLNTFTSSIQTEVDAISAATSSYLTSIDSGIVSSSAQVTELLPTGVVSGSSQITITESQISDLTHYSDSDVKTKLDTEGVISGSLVSQLPTGTISGSEQLPSGVISGSQQITDSLPSGVISGSEQLPSGVISGSTQITDASGLVSSSQQVIDHLPNGSISGSQQVIDSLPTGVVSGSFSGSVADAIDLLSEVSGANYLESQSVDSRLDTIEGSVGMYYDLSNTVWNNKYIKSGSNQASDTDGFLTGNVPFKFRLNTDRKLHYELNDVVYISNFDRDTTITATVSSSYETGSREIGFNVVSVNQSDDATRINDSYWVISRHTAGFVDSASYIEASSSFDQRIGIIVASGSGADWNVNLTNIPSGIVSSSEQQYTASIENGFALTSSLDNVSSSLATRIENVYLSSSNFDAKSLVSSSEQIDFRNVTNYVADEHIDHTTVLINAGDGLDGGGDISSTRELRLNVTSSHFEEGVKDVLTSEGVVKQSTLNTDLISTDFSQSVDTRINSISAGAVPTGTVSGSTQVDITQTENYTAFSASIATSIDGVSASPTDISALNTFTSSTDTRITNLENFSSSLDTTFATDTELTNLSSSLSASIYDAAQSGSGVSSWNELSDIPSGLLSGSEQLPSGLLSGSEQIASDISGSFTSLSESLDTKIETEKGRIDNILSGANADYDQFVEIVDLVNSTDIENDTAFANHYTSSRQRLTSLESFTGSLDATYATDSELTNLSSSLSQSIYEAAQSGSNPIETGSFATTGSNTFKGNQIVSGSIIPESTAAGNGIHDLGSLSNPFGELYITTGSVRFVRDGALVSQVSGEKDAIRVGNILITTSSLQIVSGSGDSLTTVSTIVSADVDSDGQVSNAQQLLLPDDIISGSAQITSLGFVSESFSTDGTGILSGSVDFESFSSSVDTRITNVAAGNVPAGTVSSSAQIIESLPTGVVSGSEQIEFDGNRTISNDKLGDLFTDSVNPSTTGSVIDFLNAVFYPNTGPSISTGNQTIIEYVTSGTTITTLSGTDPEGQAITFGTSSLYTDDLVRVASNGVMTLNALAESSSFNTDETGGSHGHKVEVTATDTFGTTTEKDIYVIVTPNSTPVFRETSTSGNIITSVTANLNENSTNDTLVKRIYFTDANGDSITIYSSSIDNNHFDITKYSTYVDIRQNTGSLDYEQQTSYTFSISASDEHYEAAQDTDSIVTLPITINVVDNVVPTVSDQTLSSINENSSNGATVGSISAADSEGDTITFKNFELHQLQLDGVEVSSGSYSGTSQLTDPHEEPFQMSTSGVVTKKTGVYLNSDLINRYIYRVKVTDSYNTDSEFSLVTINITDDTPATLSDNWSAGPYIKESEVSGTTIKTTNYGSTAADYGSNQSGTWSSSDSAISINSNGTLSLGVDLSGSVTQSGDTLDSTITFTNTFGTTTTDSLSLTIVANDAPTATFTNQSSNFNTNLATENTNLVSVSISDTESDTPYQLTIGGTNGSSINAVPQNAASSSWQLQASSDLSVGTYSYDVTVTDNYGKSTSYSGRSFEIAQASSGTMTENGTFYIIESATNGNLIRTNSNGRTGTQGAVVVSYSPNYGSQSATSFSSSNPLITINSSTGQLSVGTDISGSGNTNGSIIASTISWTDQYGNGDSDAIAVNVTQNFAPTVSSTNTFNENTNQATGSSEIVRLNLTDTESDSIPNGSVSFSGYNTTYFIPSISTPQMKLLVNSTSIPAGTYPYTASLQDEHGFSTTVHSGSVTISQADDGTLGGDTTSYIIESAESGDVLRDATGYNNGNPSQLSVSYSPSYGSPSVQTYSSSNPAIVVDSSGNLTLGVDISGSVTQSGDTISSTITFTDEYGNSDTDTITATVFGNSAPAASFTATSDYDSDASVSGSTAGTLTVTDTENNSPFTFTLAGTDGDKFNVAGSSSPFTVQPTGSLDAGTYSVNITVTDNYNESVTLTNETITVDAAEVLTEGYIYYSNYGSEAGFAANYLAVMGGSGVDSGTPPKVTGYTANALSPYNKFKTGDVGSSSITLAGTGKSATLTGTISGSDFNTALRGAGNMNWASGVQTIIVIPSGSTMTGIPTSMTDGVGGTTAGEYILVEYPDGTGAPLGATNTVIHQLTLDSAVNSYTDWFVIGATFQNSASGMRLQVLSSSGSISDF